MPAPSNRTGVRTALVVALLTAILLAGFGLGPHAFEFRAWPQASYDDTVKDVVTRSAGEAAEVPVVRVRRPERGRDGALAVRGRGGSSRPDLSVRSDSGRGEPPSRRGRARDGRETATQVPDVVLVPDEPTPATPDAPPSDSEEPTQLAELAEPQLQPVMRPDSDEVPAARVSEREDGEGDARADNRDVDVVDLVGGADRLLDSRLADERGHGRHGRRHGHR